MSRSCGTHGRGEEWVRDFGQRTWGKEETDRRPGRGCGDAIKKMDLR